MAKHDAPPTDLASLVDHARTLDCIHCGLCLQTCPTYRLSGAEPSSPRGRIHLMRAVGEGRLTPDRGYAEELDFCLLCRHCESVCPAGVQFGAMMEVARDRVGAQVPRPWWARALRHVGFRRLLPSRRLLRLAAGGLRLVQRLRLDRLAARVGGVRGDGLADLPRIAPGSERRALPARTPAEGPRQGDAAVLEGCVMPELFPEVNAAAVRSLARLGLETHVLPDVVCCGSLHAHNGDLEGARALGRRVLDADARLTDRLGAPPRVVIHSAGCGAHLRELGHLFPAGDPDHERAAAFAVRVVDYSEAVAPLLAARAPLAAPPSVPGPVAWDDPCHLCHAQGVRAEPRAVLARLGVPQAPLSAPESCCGSAGIYSLLRPADSQAVFESKRADLAASGARTLVTANPGCQLQWQAGLRRAGDTTPVVHLAELVDAALEAERRATTSADATAPPGSPTGA